MYFDRWYLVDSKGCQVEIGDSVGGGWVLVGFSDNITPTWNSNLWMIVLQNCTGEIRTTYPSNFGFQWVKAD